MIYNPKIIDLYIYDAILSPTLVAIFKNKHHQIQGNTSSGNPSLSNPGARTVDLIFLRLLSLNLVEHALTARQQIVGVQAAPVKKVWLLFGEWNTSAGI